MSGALDEETADLIARGLWSQREEDMLNAPLPPMTPHERAAANPRPPKNPAKPKCPTCGGACAGALTGLWCVVCGLGLAS